VIKAGLGLMGFDVGSVRRPLRPLRGPKVDELQQLITALGLKERYARWTKRPLVAAGR
jgi:dihydrodipicolinate synthase/N-acetylneuraminate lyase